MRRGPRSVWTRGLLGFALALTPVALHAVDTEPTLELTFSGGDGRALSAKQGDVLGVSRHVSNDADLSVESEPSALELTTDPELFRVVVRGAWPGDIAYAELESLDSQGHRRAVIHYVPLRREPGSHELRSPRIRLVADATDASAPGMDTQLLRVRLGDSVRATLVRDGIATQISLGVGARKQGPEARRVLRGALRLSVLRTRPGGPPVIGQDDTSALELARRQVEIANEIWAQCFVDFGAPDEAEARVVDAPPPALLAIADEDGLPARGGGQIVFLANGALIGPVGTDAGASPRETARKVARALVKRGFLAEVSVNPRAEHGAGESADVIVRTRRGALVKLTARPDGVLSSDAAQRVAIGQVDLDDGIQQFDNMIAASGTLEERTLVKLLSDGDPRTIDVLFINRFVAPERQGEAFIEADGSTMANTLILDRNAVRFERQAWVQAHELGHVLLDEPFHPDNFGWDRPSLLMDSDARAGRVTGPKRLRDLECAKARRRSGAGAAPVLLAPLD